MWLELTRPPAPLMQDGPENGVVKFTRPDAFLVSLHPVRDATTTTTTTTTACACLAPFTPLLTKASFSSSFLPPSLLSPRAAPLCSSPSLPPSL